MQDPLNVSHDISSALNHNVPVVALESSLVAQGLPAKVNSATALGMEEGIRKAGAVPATIGVIEGQIRVGLTAEEIETLSQGKAAKLAVRDIPYAVARKLDGATTVSSTARIASAAGIAVMATGGIGGVHRDFSESHDISTDLWELARTPIVVVCSGIKAVLDIPGTMEWLETHGVPVYGYQTDELPSFYSRRSGIAVPKIEDPCDLAAILKLGVGAFGMRSSVIVAVPVPEADEIDVSSEIAEALHQAAENQIKGKALTPFLLNKIGEMTGGKSVETNAALLKNNATVAAEIACALNDTDRRRMGFM